MAKLEYLLDKYKNDLLAVSKIGAADISTLVSSKTPIDKGDAIASWTPSVNKLEAENIYPSKGDTKRHDPAKVSDSLKIGDKYYYSNGLPYIRRLEYEGHSPQAPSGMMRISLAQWQNIVNNAARKVKNGS